MKNVQTVEHPLVQHLLTTLRNKETPGQVFRSSLSQLSVLLTYEATQDLGLEAHSIHTPLAEEPQAKEISDDVVLISILRAGSGMLEPALELLPFAKVGHVGIYRDRFVHSTVEYYFRVPELKGKKVLVYDPLLATGDTAIATLSRLKEYGATDLQFLCVLAAPQGAKRMAEAHPDVRVTCASLEKDLDERGYILPGLGDAGGRLYGQV